MPRRVAFPLILLVLIAALAGGCGSSDEGGVSGESTAAAPAGNGAKAPPGAEAKECGDGDLRATGVGCGEARRLRRAWQRRLGCAPAAGASRAACDLEGYRCLSAVTDRGVSVGCAQPARSVAFTAPRG